MTNVIIPNSSDPNCSMSYCSTIIAQVDCIKTIMQGTTACINIQFFDSNGDPLDLNDINYMQIQLFNDLECVVANFWYPSISTGLRGFLIEFLQSELTDGTIVNKGLIEFCLTSEGTSTSPGSVYAEIILTLNSDTSGFSQMVGIPGIMIGRIIESKIYKNGGSGGCGEEVTGI